MRIALDAGHSMGTYGKRCLKSIDRNETREWYLNDRIADKLQQLLKKYNCEVLRVDDTTGRKDISLADRVDKANDWKADVYISIHHNAGINGKSGGGTVVYHYGGTERQAQAQELYNAIVKRTGLKGNRANKVIKYAFYVIKNTKMPAFLIENGFMDSTVDTPIILTEAHADKTAQGILDYLVGMGLKKAAAKPAASTSFKVKVIVDDLNIRAGAGTKYAVTGVIKDKGTYTIVETVKVGNGSTWGLLKAYAKQRNGWINISSHYVARKD